MAKRKARRSKRRSGGGCCPTVIHLKCKVKRGGGGTAEAGPTLAQRLARFKDAQAAKRQSSYNESFGGLAGSRRGKRAADAARAARHAGTCTVKFGSSTRRMNPVAAGAYISKIKSRQHSKNCVVPYVSKG